MRTTLDIADDVLLAAKELGRQERKTAGQVLSELARRALCQADSDASIGTNETGGVPGFRPFPSRGGIVTNELINCLRDEDVY